MAFTTRALRMESRVVGGGFDSTGAAVQGKDLKVLSLQGTYDTGGPALTAADLGFSTVDYAHFNVTTPAPAADTLNEQAFWDGSNLHIRTQAAGAELGNTTAIVVEALVVGDATRNVELLP